MKTIYSSRPPAKFAGGGDVLMAVLLLVALFQIALAFHTEAGSVRVAGPISSAAAAAAATPVQVTAPLAGSGGGVSKNKSLSFQLAATRD